MEAASSKSRGGGSSRVARRPRVAEVVKGGVSIPIFGPPFSHSPSDRFRYVFKVLSGDCELPVDREDLLSPPDDVRFLSSSWPHQSLPLEARRPLYDYIVHGQGEAGAALRSWLGTERGVSLETLRLQLMRHRIAEAGMDMQDFSKSSRVMVPLPIDQWRGDGNTVATLMREITMFRMEKQKRAKEMQQMPDVDRQQRQERVTKMQQQLQDLDMTVDKLQWSGPEPTRLTFNRLAQWGDQEDPEESRRYDNASSPQSTQQRWDMGIRRLTLEKALMAAGYDPAVLMLDEKVYNRMVCYIELNLSTVNEVVEIIRDMLQNKKAQWNRKKRRTTRWAFNFE